MFVFKPSCCCCFWSQWKLTEQWLLSLHYVYASELLSTTCHEVRSVWAAVLYWMKIWLFRGFLLKFHFKQLSLLKVVFLFPFPYISSQRKDSQPEALDLSCGLLWGARCRTLLSSGATRQLWSVSGKKTSKDLNGQRFHDSTMCIILFNVLLDLMTCHLRYVTVRDWFVWKCKPCVTHSHRQRHLCNSTNDLSGWFQIVFWSPVNENELIERITNWETTDTTCPEEGSENVRVLKCKLFLCPPLLDSRLASTRQNQVVSTLASQHQVSELEASGLVEISSQAVTLKWGRKTRIVHVTVG